MSLRKHWSEPLLPVLGEDGHPTQPGCEWAAPSWTVRCLCGAGMTVSGAGLDPEVGHRQPWVALVEPVTLLRSADSRPKTEDMAQHRASPLRRAQAGPGSTSERGQWGRTCRDSGPPLPARPAGAGPNVPETAFGGAEGFLRWWSEGLPGGDFHLENSPIARGVSSSRTSSQPPESLSREQAFT